MTNRPEIYTPEHHIEVVRSLTETIFPVPFDQAVGNQLGFYRGRIVPLRKIEDRKRSVDFTETRYDLSATYLETTLKTLATRSLWAVRFSKEESKVEILNKDDAESEFDFHRFAVGSIAGKPAKYNDPKWNRALAEAVRRASRE